MPITIPDSVADPIVACIVTSVYCVLGLSAAAQIAEFLKLLAAAAVLTDWTSLPSVMVYAAALLCISIPVLKLFMGALYNKQLGASINAAPHPFAVIEYTMADGTRVSHAKYMPRSLFAPSTSIPKDPAAEPAEPTPKEPQAPAPETEAPESPTPEPAAPKPIIGKKQPEEDAIVAEI
jgi:hypothetical protein